MADITFPHALPRHIAFIMDGNGRWATRAGLPRLKGHAAGMDVLHGLCDECLGLGIPCLTFYAFSTENWSRPWDEVAGIFNLLEVYFQRELKNLMAKGIRVQFIGDHSEESRLSAETRSMMERVEAATKGNTAMTVTVALNYGGREEILRAAQRLVESHTPLTAETLAAALDTCGLPDPDLIIRTGGEQRLSNFLLWQSSYAELYFSPLAWPEFGAAALREALADYAGRQRRFGGLVPDKDKAVAQA
jgi:undecaprenyl diphosphate synthase